MVEDHIEKLCRKYLVSNYEKIREEYMKYKAKHIDALNFTNDTMLSIYEHAFFLHMSRIKVSRKSFSKGMNQRLFKAALNEIENRCLLSPGGKQKEEYVVCNLYSIFRPERNFTSQDESLLHKKCYDNYHMSFQ